MFAVECTDRGNVAFGYNEVLGYERKQIQTHATTWMCTEDVLSEVSQSQRTYTVGFHFSQIQTDRK